MVVNIILLGLIFGVLLGLNLVSLLPIFVIKIVSQLKINNLDSLGYEKYENADDEKKSMQSRYYFRAENNVRTTCTGKIYLLVIGISVLLFEVIALSLYFLLS